MRLGRPTLVGAATITAVACAAVALAASQLVVAIQIAPSTLILNSSQSDVTVHAEIAYSAVDGGSVSLSGIPAKATFADSCGELVAKFDEAVVKASVKPGAAELVLTGLKKDGVPFEGADTVRVIVKR